jgi:hypothetical protein
MSKIKLQDLPVAERINYDFVKASTLKEINEIKSLLKDQQEYAQIIQSLLKKINKLENKAIVNE